MKVKRLLMNHNLDEISTHSEVQNFHLLRVLKCKKMGSKEAAISQILQTFFLNCVFHRSLEFSYLEILGSPTNVLIGEFVANFLTYELQNLWLLNKKTYFLKGKIQKNSFFHGIAKGYLEKIKALKIDEAQEGGNSLIILEQNLIEAKQLAYGKLQLTKGKRKICRNAENLGKEAGKNLKIQKAIPEKPSFSKKLIQFFS